MQHVSVDWRIEHATATGGLFYGWRNATTVASSPRATAAAEKAGSSPHLVDGHTATGTAPATSASPTSKRNGARLPTNLREDPNCYNAVAATRSSRATNGCLARPENASAPSYSSSWTPPRRRLPQYPFQKYSANDSAVAPTSTSSWTGLCTTPSR